VKQKDVHQAELKGVEYAIECSILKVAVSEDVQNCADEGSKSMEEWDSQRILQWKVPGEMPE
jgi:cAMP phosphodiesterase